MIVFFLILILKSLPIYLQNSNSKWEIKKIQTSTKKILNVVFISLHRGGGVGRIAESTF